MTQLLDVHEQRRDQILTEAADRQLQAVISHRLDSGWTTYKSRILQADSAGGFLILEHPRPAPGQIPPELAPGEKIGLAFRRGHKKCLCSVEIARLATFELPDGQSTAAVQIPWPDKLQEIQRRVYYRAAVPSGRRIEVRMWDGGIVDRDPAELQNAPHHTGLLQDISGGGCRVEIDAVRDPQLRAGDTVGIQFQPDPRSEPLRIDAVFRHVEQDPAPSPQGAHSAGRAPPCGIGAASRSKRSLGFQFVGLEMSTQGRGTLQALSRVVSTFLRIEARRKRNRLQKGRQRRK